MRSCFHAPNPVGIELGAPHHTQCVLPLQNDSLLTLRLDFRWPLRTLETQRWTWVTAGSEIAVDRGSRHDASCSEASACIIVSRSRACINGFAPYTSLQIEIKRLRDCSNFHNKMKNFGTHTNCMCYKCSATLLVDQ